MAAVVTLYGSSDDLIEVEGVLPGCDEYQSEDSHFVLTGHAGAVRIRVWFTRNGVWAIAAAPVDEDVKMLPVEIGGTAKGYSAIAIVRGVSMVVREAASDA